MYLNEKNSTSVLNIFCSFICKQFSASQGGQYLDAVDCVWNSNDWHRISCYYDFQHLLPLYVKSISNVILHEKIMVRLNILFCFRISIPLFCNHELTSFMHLQDILKYVSKSVKESVLLLNGELKNQLDLIKNIKEKVNERIVQNATESEAPSQIVADLYAPCVSCMLYYHLNLNVRVRIYI